MSETTPIAWCTPFASPDPLSFDASLASTMLTGPGSQLDLAFLQQSSAVSNESTSTETRNTSGKPDEPSPGSVETQPGTGSHESSAKADNIESSHSSTPSLGCKTQQLLQRSQDSPQTPIYVPYRPWYSPLAPSESPTQSPVRVDSCAALSDMRDLCNGTTSRDVLSTHKQGYIQEVPETLVTDCSENLDEYSKVAALGGVKVAREMPPMPTRTPLLPPNAKAIQRKNKPLASPLRSAYRITNLSTPSRQGSGDSQDVCPSPSDLVTKAMPSTDAAVGIHEATTTTIESAFIAMNAEAVPTTRKLRRRSSAGDLTISREKSSSPMSVAAISWYTVRGKSSPDLLRSVSNFLGPKATHSGTRRRELIIPLSRSRSLHAPEIAPTEANAASSPMPAPMRRSTFNESRDSNNNGEGSSRASSIPDGIKENLETSRIEKICTSWNSRQWTKAESYLTYHLTLVEDSKSDEASRRVRHLLGVCASYRGQWQRALSWFISVIRTPVEDAGNLDVGDRAAFYWLGDTYAMMNRKEEAMLAYCLAGTCEELASALKLRSSHRCLSIDQETMRNTVAKASFKALWASDSFRKGKAAVGTISYPSVVSQAASQACLQRCSSDPGECLLRGRHENFRSRESQARGILLKAAHFQAGQPWPMICDATFAMDAVARGRLVAIKFDALEAARSHSEPFPLRRSFVTDRLNSFVCEDIQRLVITIRTCLKTLAMEWSETSRRGKILFLARYDAVQEKIASTVYFCLEITKTPLRPGYGIAYCAGSLCSARALKPPSTHAATEKQLKTLLRETLKSVYAQFQSGASASDTPIPPRTPSQPRKDSSSPAPTAPPSPETTPTPSSQSTSPRPSTATAAAAPAPSNLPARAPSSLPPSILPPSPSTPPPSIPPPSSPPSVTILPIRTRARASLRAACNHHKNPLGALKRRRRRDSGGQQRAFPLD